MPRNNSFLMGMEDNCRAGSEWMHFLSQIFPIPVRIVPVSGIPVSYVAVVTETKFLQIHPPHSCDFSRELGGCGRPHI